jgi:ABC-type glycerol-3-phosphate transport system substrate-binding protein
MAGGLIQPANRNPPEVPVAIAPLLLTSNASRLTWDQATRKLASGGCVVESMNDSAFGELVASGAHEGEDFGAIPFPGTADSFLAVVDVFVAATKATDAKNALAFLSGIENPATQLAFSRAKGSIPVVRRQRLLASGLPAAILQPNKDGESHRPRRDCA